ncbi:hypothetical protein J2W91_000607 [Paenibacillus amylolyticus]|uniref:DUF3939 domain-containing protein n=1 Tax=Paenibacillus amylolyticus TaxID=1451 RepID=A0AAP5H113_PAEAM|nr:hypothetical protein [Paenibacillus amylolyticus]MDR6722159.1 hypothetical protein [Paenibacillus amylolyticus]
MIKNSSNTQWSRRRRHISALFLFLLFAFVGSGCMYQSQSGADPKVAYRESVSRIQLAVEAFQQDQGILPILNAGEETPKFEKFRVDLAKLKQQGYIDEIPVTAFENGGSAYFLIQNEEVKPTIKVMDLQTVQKVNDVQRMVNQYKSVHNGKLPVGEELYPGLHVVNMKEAAVAGAPEVTLNSVYSGQELPFMVDGAGNVYVDYAFDIMQAVEKSEESPTETMDVRDYLVEHSYFVPVKSVTYAWESNAPVAKSNSL